MATVEARKFNLFYGTHHALKDVDVAFSPMQITAVIGPSGCGKSTLLRSVNRMNDLYGATTSGEMIFGGKNIYDGETDLVALRRRVGMVFQRPNPFPLSVFDNVAIGPRMHEVNKGRIAEVVEHSLIASDLWDKVKDKLQAPALSLSLGEQQQLCIARVIATSPEVILFDEPASALDPVTTRKIEDLMRELCKQYTVIVVTHNMQQAARVSDTTVFMLQGQMVEAGPTQAIFTTPKDKRTEDYITGRFG